MLAVHTAGPVVAAIAVTAAIMALTPGHELPQGWCVGTIERNSLERQGGGYRMRLRVDMCHMPDSRDPQPRELVVTYPRSLPYDVCEGSYVYVPGSLRASVLEARGFELTHSKYDPCLHEHCLPDALRSPRCRSDAFFK